MSTLPIINWEETFIWMTLSGIAILAISYLWLLVVAFRTRLAWGLCCLFFPPLLFIFIVRFWARTWKPFLLTTVGVFLVGFPPFYTRFVRVDLGPRERIVDGGRHITLTGWDRKDYEMLGSKSDVVLLQIANPDVTDQTLEILRPLSNLRELDLNGSAVTDAGLMTIRELPKLEILRLGRTRITDEGFTRALADKDSLQMLDLSGTSVSRETVKAWKSAKPKRKALQ